VGNGTIYEEPVAVYVTTVETHQLTEITTLLETARTIFRQQAIWVEYHEIKGILLTDRTGESFDEHSVLVPAHTEPAQANGKK